LPEDRPEQIRDYVESLAGGLAPSAIAGWLKTVAETAGRLCPGCRARYEPGGYFGELVAPTRKDAECLIRAIDMHADGAPELVRAVLAACRTRLQQQLAG
jgi:hypothetical protein